MKGEIAMTWQHISYSDGSNPYICTTEEKFKRLKRKYGKRMKLIKENFWYVETEVNKNNFLN